MATPTIGFSIPNMITVTLMVLIVFAIIGFVMRAMRGAGGAPSDGNPDTGSDA